VWNDSESAIDSVQAPIRWGALLPVGRMRVRRGQPDGDSLLDEAWALSVSMAELQRTGPIAAARAESAWLRGDLAAARQAVEHVYAEARELGSVAHAAELGYWVAKAGQPVTPSGADHPYGLLVSGRWADAAELWRAAGAPYEHALALTESDDPANLLVALETLDQLEARPLARIVRRRLRELGVTHVPRGPAGATRLNPAGLTERQAEVLRLMSDGLGNAEIAAQLVLSVRTVETHVAAVLDKLGVHTRRDAVARAADFEPGE
jgi:DNA-binding CsgD family transcriptional regulator